MFVSRMWVFDRHRNSPYGLDYKRGRFRSTFTEENPCNRVPHWVPPPCCGAYSQFVHRFHGLRPEATIVSSPARIHLCPVTWKSAAAIAVG